MLFCKSHTGLQLEGKKMTQLKFLGKHDIHHTPNDKERNCGLCF